MSNTDPIADMLTRIRNGLLVHRESIVAPSSKTKAAILKILKNEGYIENYEVIKERSSNTLKINLLYRENGKPLINGLKRVSKPGLRVYADKKDLPRFYGGSGISIISTSKGVISGKEAWKLGIGGELLCYIW